MSGVDFEGTKFCTEDLIKIFLSDYNHDVPLAWFDVEMKKALNVDIYSYPFPKEKGYVVIEKENIKLLILKLELPDTLKQKIISDFLGIKEFEIILKNVGGK